MRYTENDRELFLQSAEIVAPMLLGKVLCRKMPNGEILRMIITETEAYPADDSACYGYGYEGNHGDKKKTAANAPLFELGGTCCLYGGMILIGCGEKGKPDNVLIRGGIHNGEYCGGPCTVANALKADKQLHGINITQDNSELWIEEKPGISYLAVARKGLSDTVCVEDKDRKLRFFAV